MDDMVEKYKNVFCDYFIFLYFRFKNIKKKWLQRKEGIFLEKRLGQGMR